MVHACTTFAADKRTVSNKFKPCLTKQLLIMFNLWFE